MRKSLLAVPTVLLGLSTLVSANELQTKMVAEYPQEILDQAKKAPEGTAEFLESLTDKDYYPLLKPGDWMGIETGSVYQVLLGSNEDPKLVIAYAAETPSNYFFLDGDKEIDLQEAASNAFKNIDKLEVEWYFPEGYNEQVVAGMPGSFVSETILSAKQMKKIHSMLGTNEIIVSIPTRTVLSAVAFDSPDDVFAQFASNHIHTWNEHRNSRISPELFIVKDGQIINLIPLTK
ncbi:hypothetical protein [Vibrio coralliilyticus]|uniref:hypothetical protein n=2 Tax=Vibrio coralliilyticus TaxID=190893 RepID=UPI001180BF87|nr:hypothetical protein [Vibrio coralliilyticus]